MYFLQYYYFRLYKYFSNGDAIPFFSTFLVITVFGYFNLITFVDFLSIIMDKRLEVPAISGIGKFWPVIFLAPLFGLFHYYLKTLGNHSMIMNRFDKETSKPRILSVLFVIIYFIVSIGLFVFILWLRQKIRHY